MTRSVITLVLLLSLLAPAASDAAFPGANGKIAFVRAGDIWTMNPDGTSQANLTNTAVDESNPAWSPDGNRIAFDRIVSGFNRQLYVMFADGTGVTPITTSSSNFDGRADPSWSPDGAKLVFMQQSGPFVATINADGTGETTIYFGTDGFDPEWSPDGTKIAWTEEGGNGCAYNIWTIDPNGNNLAFLDSCSAEHLLDQLPTWSPDAAKVAFSSDDGCAFCGTDHIRTINRDGTGAVTTGILAFEPAWSPDGAKFVYGTTGANGRIHTVNVNGTNDVDLTNGDHPDWQPIPINSYPRPKGATPFRASLSTAYNQCTASDRTHGPPLAFPSCASPQKSSAHLTVGTGDSNGLPARNEGYLRLETLVGAPGGPDDADVKLDLFMDDVFTNALADYTGEIRGRVMLRITDKDNTPHPGGPGAATTTDIPLDVIASCTPIADPQEGSVCTVSTTADALAPGTVKESRRSVWQLGRAEVYDGGPDGDANTASGDTLFATQGLFIP